MLSTGTDFEVVPTDPAENVRYRLEVYEEARKNPTFRAGILELCKNDIAFFVNLFCWQFNPLKSGVEFGPFIYRPHQLDATRRLLQCYEDGDDAVIEKSREEGGTYICLLLMVWMALFLEHKKFLIVSRNEKAVNDRNDPMSVFWKIDTVLRYLPDWVRGEVKVTKTGYRFKRSGSYITGTASTKDVGVGDRAAIVFLDEFSKVQDGAAMRQAVSSTTNCAIYNGTHEGVGTEFAALCNDPRIVKVQMHWTQNPEKTRGLYEYDPLRPSVPVIHDKGFPFPPDYQFVLDGTPTGGPRPGLRSPWYDKKCAKIGSVQGVAMDLDINPTGSSSQFFDPIVIRRLTEKARPPLWVGELRHDRDSGEPHGITEGLDEYLRLWCKTNHLGHVAPAPYAVGADVGEGVGSTPSTVSIMDCRTGQKVAEVESNRIKVEAFATLCVALCQWFVDSEGRPAKLVWEKSGSVGGRFKSHVLDLGFWSIYYHIDTSAIAPVVSDTPGFHQTPTSKGLLLRSYHAALTDGRCQNPSARALKSCLGFRTNGKGEPEHPYDKSQQRARHCAVGDGIIEHGDLAIADALAWMLVENAGLQLTPARQKRRGATEEEFPVGSLGARMRERELARAEASYDTYYEE